MFLLKSDSIRRAICMEAPVGCRRYSFDSCRGTDWQDPECAGRLLWRFEGKGRPVGASLSDYLLSEVEMCPAELLAKVLKARREAPRILGSLERGWATAWCASARRADIRASPGIQGSYGRW